MTVKLENREQIKNREDKRMRNNTRIQLGLSALICATAFLLFTISLEAQQTLQVLHSHVRAAVASGQAAPVGLLPPTRRMNLAIILPLRNQTELASLLDRLYDPSSPDYRHFLTVAQFTEQFGPTVQDYQAVVDFARANGFTVTDTPPNRLLVDINGSVAQIDKAFHVVMTVYQHPTENRTFYSPDREPALDLNVSVAHIAGLNNFSIPQPGARRGATEQGVQNDAGTGPGGAFLGSDMRAAYYGGAALTGSGQAVGLLEFSGYSLSDVQLYFRNAGQALNVPINNVTLDGATAGGWTNPNWEAEVVLDIDQAISMAPSMAQVRVYIAPAIYDADILNKMATDNLAKQLSCSWYWYPDDPATDNPFFQEFAAQGQSLFVISGDLGAYTGSDSSDESYPGEDIYVTTVGGTHLTTNGAGGSWQSETAWSYSGGGPSDDGFAIPTWQAPVINSSNGGSYTKRNAPDVAAEGDYDNYICYNNGTCQGNWGGTSFATPRWAGFMALINQQAAANGYSPLGFLNPTIYLIGQGLNYNNDFHDITSGNNNNGKGQSYNAVVGYDLVTGWGSPNGQSLINDLSIGNLIPTITTLSLSATSVPFGTTVTLTATVKPSYGNGTPTGTVAFYDYFNNGAILLSTQTLPPSDVVTYSSSSFAIGTHSLTAIYDGDQSYFASISPVSSLSVTSDTYSISGQVTYNGSGLAGVTMSLSGGAAGSTTTNSSGNYSFSGLAGGANYVVVPTLSGYTFSPPSQGFTGLNANQTANFTAYASNVTYTISGQVTLAGSGLAGVAMTLSEGESGSTTTNSAGNYSFAGLPGGINYLVTPSLSGYVFNPPASGFDPLNSNQTANFVASTSPNPVLAFTPGIISTAAGNGNAGYTGDGSPAVNAELYSPSGVTVDALGNQYIADTWNNVIRRVSATTGFISTVAGNGYGSGQGYGGYSGDGASATSAELYFPTGVAVDLAGNVYIADYQNSRIRVVNMQSSAITIAGVTIQPGNIATVAGNGTQGYSGDKGPATAAQLFFPSGVAVDTAGNIYIADKENCVVRMVSTGAPSPFVSGNPTNGYIYTVAGNGTPGSSGNAGPATSAELRGPNGVSVDSSGNLYIADSSNSMVRFVSATTNGTRTQDYIYTVDGTGAYGYAGDGGPATSAALNLPEGVAVDNAGNLYIADSSNNRIREVTASTGIITTVAGNGTGGYAGDNGSAKSAELNNPYGVSVAFSTGNFYIADPGNNRLREVNVQQTSLIFGVVNVGQTSAAQDVTISNVGTQTLNINQISASAAFNTNGADTTCSSGKTLAPSASCIVSIEFAPVNVGPVTGSLVITDNASNSPQSVSLSGTGAQGTPTLTWNPATTSIAYGTGLSAGVLDATATANGNPVAGNYAYSATASGGSPQSVTVGTILPVGAYTLSVLFTPTDTTDYTTAAASVPFTVSPASLAVQLTSSATSIIVGQTVTFTAVLSGMAGGVGPTGSVAFYDGTTQIGTGPVTLISGQYQAVYSTNSLAVGQHNITAQYLGDANYNAAASNTVIVTVNPNTPPLMVSPTVLSFGNHALGSTSAAKKVTLNNKTGVVVAGISWTVVGANPSDFTQSATTCGTTLKVKASCTVSIVFAPGAVGARSATLTIADSASNSPQSVSLTGTGILPVTVTPAAEKYPASKVGTTSAAKTVTIKNSLPTVLTLLGASFTGANAGDFAQSGTTCGGSLGAGLTCTVSITFTPTAKGSRVATLNISDSAVTSPQTVALSGTGK